MARFSASGLDSPSTSTGPSVTFCKMLMWANRLKLWNTMPRSARMAASSRPSWGRGLPSMRISHESMVSKRLMARHSVDLPEPEGPITTTTSPLADHHEDLALAHGQAHVLEHMQVAEMLVHMAKLDDGSHGTH